MNNKTYFISYTTRTENDEKWAVWIEYVLRKIVGAETIMQKYDFHPGDNFKAMMDNALKQSNAVVCVLTRTYLESTNCQDEWTNAEHIIPIKCDDFEIKGLLKNRVYIDLYGLDNNAAREALVKGLEEELRPDDEPEFPFAPDANMPEEPDFPGVAVGSFPERNQLFTDHDDLLSVMELRDYFISYNKTDKAWAKRIVGILMGRGYTVHIQAWDIRPSDDFPRSRC